MVVFAVVFVSTKLDFAYASRRKQSQLLDPLIKNSSGDFDTLAFARRDCSDFRFLKVLTAPYTPKHKFQRSARRLSRNPSPLLRLPPGRPRE